MFLKAYFLCINPNQRSANYEYIFICTYFQHLKRNIYFKLNTKKPSIFSYSDICLDSSRAPISVYLYLFAAVMITWTTYLYTCTYFQPTPPSSSLLNMDRGGSSSRHPITVERLSSKCPPNP